MSIQFDPQFRGRTYWRTQSCGCRRENEAHTEIHDGRLVVCEIAAGGVIFCKEHKRLSKRLRIATPAEVKHILNGDWA